MSRRATALLFAALAAFGCARRARLTAEADTTRPESEWLRQEPIRLLREYIRIETTEAKGEEEGTRFLARLLACDRIETEIVCPAPRRCNLLARLPGRRREGALLLLNHVDVAEAYPQFWTEEPPFEGRIKGGYMYGRGAYDMKSLGLAQALALRAVASAGIVPESDVLFLAEADEETTQRWGSAWLLAHRPEWFRGVANVLNEGGVDEMILRDVRYWGLETLQAGYAAADFEAPSAQALSVLASRWPRLSAPPVAPDPQVVLGFDMLANHLVPPLTGLLRDLPRVARDPNLRAQLPDRYGAFLEPRLHWFDPYPFPPESKDAFRADVIVFTPPRVDPEVFLGPIVADAASSGIRVVRSFSGGPTDASPYPTPFTELLRRATVMRYPGIPFGPLPTFAGYTTSMLFRRKGYATYGYSPIPMNIFDTVRRHGNNERIYLRDYVNGVALYAAAVADFATDSGVPGPAASGQPPPQNLSGPIRRK
jgi:acetylornithine deacetylase/succinyl-diaminopimelate desuccinylase-like protein